VSGLHRAHESLERDGLRYGDERDLVGTASGTCARVGDAYEDRFACGDEPGDVAAGVAFLVSARRQSSAVG
jgi:hypothetical protein